MYAIVPAYNEEPTVAGVVTVLRAADVFDDVVVVDDGSTDRTFELAQDAGARVIKTPRNLGKGDAMLYAYDYLPNDDLPVGFFDADLLGLRPSHVLNMAQGTDDFDMVAGLRDKGGFQNVLQVIYSPLITGERILQRWILDQLPKSCWSGYSIETAINDVVERHGGRTLLLVLDGVHMRTKSDKVGLVNGLRGHWRMAKQILRTRRALRDTEGMSCQIAK